jgi:hypothetical protein
MDLKSLAFLTGRLIESPKLRSVVQPLGVFDFNVRAISLRTIPNPITG